MNGGTPDERDRELQSALEENRRLRERVAALEPSRKADDDEDYQWHRQRFELAVKASRDGIWDWNVRENKFDLSDQYLAILGYEKGFMFERPEDFFALVHPDDAEYVERNVREYVTGERAEYDVQFRMRHRRGIYIWVRARAAALRDEEGKPYRIVGSLTDITDLMNYIEEADRRKHILNTIIDSAPIGIWMTSPDGEVEMVNEQFANDVGLGTASVSITENERAECALTDRRALESDEPIYTEEEITFSDGVRHTLQTIKRRATNAAGETLGVVGIGIDVTERKKVERSLAFKRALLAGVSEATNELLTNADFRASVNNALSRLGKAANVDRVYIFRNHDEPETGRPLLSQDFEWTSEDVEPQIDNPELQNMPYEEGFERWREILSRGEAIDGLVEDFPEGERDVLEAQDILSIVVVPIMILEEFWGFVGFDDCSHRRRWIESEKAILKAAAGSIGGAIARDRQRRELELAKNAAESSTRAKEQFLAHMSHEIRTPMNAVMGVANILLNLAPTEEQRRFLNVIRDSSENLLVIINDVLDFSKIEAGKIEFAEEDFDVREAMERVAGTLRYAIEEKGLTFDVEVAEDVPNALNGDPVRLNQIVLNLCSNAVKFTERGGVRLRVETDALENGRVVATFRVEDTGVGIPPNKLDEVFESFRQVGSKSAKKVAGTGLGLAIVKRLTEAQGGSVVAESVLGEGSTFVVELPFARARGGEEEGEERAKREDLKGVRVLVVEDNDMNRMVVENMLKMWRADCDLVEHGGEALDALRARDYDIILMDLSMPVMDGYEATDAIRKTFDAPKKDVPILALTASALISSKSKILDAGMNGHVPKPFKPNDLFNKIVEAIERGGDVADAELVATVDSAKGTKSEKAPAIPAGYERTDLSYLAETSGDEQTLMREIVERFLEQTPAQYEALEREIRDENFTNARALAHKIKPTADYVGATRLRELYETMERLAEEGDSVTALEERLREAVSEYKEVERELRMRLAEKRL
ncbi:MAG: response regulator [Ignavibacteriales bacterium]|nr:response regulator [Ignavibacteriales bacterium]